MKLEVFQAGDSWSWHARAGRNITHAGHGLNSKEGAKRAAVASVIASYRKCRHILFGVTPPPSVLAELRTALLAQVVEVK